MIKRQYHCKEWHEFSMKVKSRDNYCCVKCLRNSKQTSLQVHHLKYVPYKSIWEYNLFDCVTLCKGCHAKEHKKIEPSSGWTLIDITDLGELSGTCERKGCGTEIRYEHLTYHPEWGYKTVGSTCIEYLTVQDQFMSKHVLETFKSISKFRSHALWSIGFTQKKMKFIYTTYSHNQIRIYGTTNNHSYQILLKEKGAKWFDFHDIWRIPNTDLEIVKELGFIALKGLTTTDHEEKKQLRIIYSNLKIYGIKSGS